MFEYIKLKFKSRFKNFSKDRIREFLKKNGLAFVIILVGWEIMEDFVFPVIFGFLGNYIHPAFYVGIPASIILCFHWLAVPILWGIWLRLSNQEGEPAPECCDSNHN